MNKGSSHCVWFVRIADLRVKLDFARAANGRFGKHSAVSCVIANVGTWLGALLRQIRFLR